MAKLRGSKNISDKVNKDMIFDLTDKWQTAERKVVSLMDYVKTLEKHNVKLEKEAEEYRQLAKDALKELDKFPGRVK